MLPKKKDFSQGSMFFGLEDMLSQKHPMYILANKVNWQLFEEAFSPLYCLDNGRGYKGKRQINDTTIEIPKPFSSKKQTQYQQNKLKKTI